MPDSSPDESEAARMELTPDAIHEEDEGLFLDCPQCGSPVSISHIVNEGRCTGVIEGDAYEAESKDEQLDGGCNAELSLELVWKA